MLEVALGGLQRSSQELEQGGLASAIGTDEARPARREVELHAGEQGNSIQVSERHAVRAKG